VNIVRAIARKSSNRLNFFWLKVICWICKSNELEREIKQNTGGSSRGLATNLGGHGPPSPPLRTATECCVVNKLVKRSDVDSEPEVNN